MIIAAVASLATKHEAHSFAAQRRCCHKGTTTLCPEESANVASGVVAIWRLLQEIQSWSDEFLHPERSSEMEQTPARDISERWSTSAWYETISEPVRAQASAGQHGLKPVDGTTASRPDVSGSSSPFDQERCHTTRGKTLKHSLYCGTEMYLLRYSWPSSSIGNSTAVALAFTRKTKKYHPGPHRCQLFSAAKAGVTVLELLELSSELAELEFAMQKGCSQNGWRAKIHRNPNPKTSIPLHQPWHKGIQKGTQKRYSRVE